MYTFANVFAMQLFQSLNYDNNSVGSSTTAIRPCSSDVSNDGIKKFDGYIFKYEQNRTQCSQSYSDMCSDLSGTISYISKIKDGLSKSGSSTSSSNTQIISNSQTAVCTMMKSINTANGSDVCDVSDCP